MAVRTATRDPARDWALRCLSEFEAQGTPLERLFERCPAALDSRDSRFARQLILGTLRWRRRIDWILDRFARKPMATTEAQLRQVLRLGAYQIIWLDGIPDHAAVNGAVEQARRCGLPVHSLAMGDATRTTAGRPVERPAAHSGEMRVSWARWVRRMVERKQLQTLWVLYTPRPAPQIVITTTG